ncbi:hypothetical protein D3C87_1694370 [compost metagenome]
MSCANSLSWRARTSLAISEAVPRALTSKSPLIASSGLNFMFQWYSACRNGRVMPSSQAVIRSLMTMLAAAMSIDMPAAVPAAPWVAFSPLM